MARPLTVADGGISPWEWFAGGGLVVAGAGFLKLAQRFIAWLDKRAALAGRTRAAGLQDWEDKLTARESAFDAAIDDRLKSIEGQLEQRRAESVALRMAFELAAEALRRVDPKNPALKRAEQLLIAAFPLDPTIPAPMLDLLHQIEGKTA